MSVGDIQKEFEALGGKFYMPAGQLVDALAGVRVFLFDWDGVFNAGMKADGYGSPFGEADSMGLNLLRLSYWLKHGVMARAGIITGATNEAAEYFTQRESLDYCVRGFTDKGQAFEELCERAGITPEEVAFVYDDVLDLPVANRAAVRLRVRRDSGPLFTRYVEDHNLCDYLTSAPGGQHAVRECCELIMGLCFDFAGAVDVRRTYGSQYQEYLALRKATQTLVITPA